MTTLTKIAWGRIAYSVIGLCIALVGGIVLQPSFHNSPAAAEVLVTVFSILAGFLIAVMTMLGDEGVLRRAKNWAEATADLERIEARLQRHQLTFYLYLFVLVLAFALSFDKAWNDQVDLWLERVILFVGLFAFWISFRLPSHLLNHQMTSLRESIRERRAREAQSNGP